jgi:hypothetical protein
MGRTRRGRRQMRTAPPSSGTRARGAVATVVVVIGLIAVIIARSGVHSPASPHTTDSMGSVTTTELHSTTSSTTRITTASTQRHPPPTRPGHQAKRPAARPPQSAAPNVPMPIPRLTPGAIQSSDTSAICTAGWASAHRDVSWSTEDAVAAEYGLASHEGYEIDHLIPLELGGSNSIANLWPEPYYSRYGAIEKDGLEDWLHEQVCNGSLALAAAQHEIATNWYTAWVTAGRPMPSWFGYSNAPPGGGSTGSSAPTTAAPSTTSGNGAAWCSATASPSNDGYSGDYEVYVHSNQPDTKATASDSGDTWSDYTDSSGYGDIRLYHTAAGESITVTVGGATCSTTA